MIFPLLFILFNSEPAPVSANAIWINFAIPRVEARPYHRPYVAVWLEDDARNGVKTFLVWHEQEDWLKDLRRWWRKMGRDATPPFDGVSGATPKPGDYKLSLQTVDMKGVPLKAGTYTLHLEVVREKGGREYFVQEIQLGGHTPQTYTLKGDVEIGQIVISIH